jgi:putative glycerol-1-phosphate prenyltransferase
MNVFSYLLEVREKKGAGFLVLIDPDKFNREKIDDFLAACGNGKVDAFLVGGSLLGDDYISEMISEIKERTDIPVILFPGGTNQVTRNADAILYLSLISGRNPDYLIGKHVISAPIIKRYGLETISTGYMLVESGKTTTAEYMSNTKPLPFRKYDIAVATALAGEYLGMKMLYLEAGSGAEYPIPAEMVQAVAENVSVPIIVGGGLRLPKSARNRVEAGASFIVVGNHFENPATWDEIRDFARAIHYKQKR